MKTRLKNWRTYVILFLIIIVGAAIFSRLFFVQVLQRKHFSAQALGQQAEFLNLTGARGQIYCQNSAESKGGKATGEVKSLSINKDTWILSASLKDIKDKDVFADILSKNINKTKEQIISELSAGQSNYAILERNIPEDQLNKIKKLELSGLTWQKITERYHPQGDFSSQLLGFLGGEGTGQYGIEGYYDNILTGKTGVSQQKAGLGSLLSSTEKEILDGSDIYLTIDYNIQLQAEALLKKTKESLDIEAGQIIVLKPDTGKILALANFPSFNLNNYSKENLEIFQNGAVQKLFEPGSIMKPFTMAAAINEGKITPETTYEDKGSLKFGPETIHNYHNMVFGKQTMTQVLENSINTGAVFAEEQMDHKLFFSYLDKFGFFQKTGVGLQGEVASRNEALKNGNDVEYATASFGQGIELTPLQIARAFCALAIDGKMPKPYIIEKIVSGKEEQYTKPEYSDQIISKQTISQLTPMLINVIDGGLPKQKIPGYYVAGKTGTAQIPLPNGRGYDPDKTIQSFVGFAPALNPQFLILVKLDNPRSAKSALSAVPVFKELASYIINYWKIPPDYDITKVDNKK